MASCVEHGEWERKYFACPKCFKGGDVSQPLRSTPQLPTREEIKRLLDNLQAQHVAITAGSGYDPDNYSSGYSEAADMIRRLQKHLTEIGHTERECFGECPDHRAQFDEAAQSETAPSATRPTLAEAVKECQIVLDDVSYGKDRPWREGAIYAAERCLKRVRDLYVGDQR